jgi:chemotaxis protein CheD
MMDGELARNRYFDPQLGLPAVKLLPGEYHVSRDDIVQVTVLGSCVAACLRDSVECIGGMNHFMLPDSGSEGATRFGASSRYGAFAMELLINELLKLGAKRANLEAKVFGGGNVMKTLSRSSTVGERNAEFVLKFLATEKIKVLAQDLIDIYPRKIYHFPRTGVVRMKKLRDMHNKTIFDRERDYSIRIREKAKGGDVELFG